MPVFLFALITVILFFPLVFGVYVFFDGESKRLNFSVYLYKKVKIFGGFVEKCEGEYILHHSDKRARMFKKDDMNKIKIKLKDKKYFELLSSRLVASFPFSSGYCNFGGIITVASNFLCPQIRAKKDFIKLKSTVYIGKDEYVKIYHKLKFVTTLCLIIILLLIMAVRNEK